eukprot:CAMPEP_0117677314 /NCGR_PEP_ID=MMETSP0804-20121206/16680_1 /TAXON_ID=1074897 /ORGANISM="Tetraselmis astigmatica, Strain CCMP880" /LENGTH=138 /DNA_ID=CAMNT_0005486591 /DNA_START=316 /DNA_END=732 /DNA_ORIENTATION=-
MSSRQIVVLAVFAALIATAAGKGCTTENVQASSQQITTCITSISSCALNSGGNANSLSDCYCSVWECLSKIEACDDLESAITNAITSIETGTGTTASECNIDLSGTTGSGSGDSSAFGVAQSSVVFVAISQLAAMFLA